MLSAADVRRFSGLGSLRGRFTLAAAVTIAIVLAIVWFLLQALFEDHIERLTEDDLRSRLLELAGAVELGESGHIGLAFEPTDPKYQRPGGGAYWRIEDKGEIILRSVSLWDSDLAPLPVRHFSPSGIAISARGPKNSTVYLAAREVTPDGADAGRKVRIEVAVDTSMVEGLQQSFRRQLFIALAVIGGAVSIGAWLQASFGLSPLKGLRDQLSSIRFGGATRMQGVFPSEIAPLIEELNLLLVRQDELVRRARERAGDLAHGLKTPLTILQIETRKVSARGEIEIAAKIREQIEAMKSHVERELSRARMSGSTTGGHALVEPSLIVDRLIRIMQQMPRGDEIEWRNDLPAGARFLMDAQDFGEIAGNLLDNARKHAKSAVRISIDATRGDSRICFDDDGCGIPDEERENLRRRGERATGEGEGSGLGLSIVIESLKQHNLELEIEGSPLSGTRMAFAAPGWSEAKP